MNKYSSQIDALIYKIIEKHTDIDPNSSPIQELISKNVWGLTPKEAYDRVITEIPIDHYDSYEVDNICNNCLVYGFPCLNCADYIYNGYIGMGNGPEFPQSGHEILCSSFSKWMNLVKFKPGFRFKSKC